VNTAGAAQRISVGGSLQSRQLPFKHQKLSDKEVPPASAGMLQQGLFDRQAGKHGIA
jgi:hypothetical protein